MVACGCPQCAAARGLPSRPPAHAPTRQRLVAMHLWWRVGCSASVQWRLPHYAQQRAQIATCRQFWKRGAGGEYGIRLCGCQRLLVGVVGGGAGCHAAKACACWPARPGWTPQAWHRCGAGARNQQAAERLLRDANFGQLLRRRCAELCRSSAGRLHAAGRTRQGCPGHSPPRLELWGPARVRAGWPPVSAGMAWHGMEHAPAAMPPPACLLLAGVQHCFGVLDGGFAGYEHT